MARPLKDYRYKSIGGSLAMYKKGKYVGSIPHAKLYHLILERQGNGKGEVLVKKIAWGNSAIKVGSGKEPGEEGK